MWTLFFILVVILLLLQLALAFAWSLFGATADVRRSLWRAAFISAAAAYCCWHAFW